MNTRFTDRDCGLLATLLLNTCTNTICV